MTSVSPLLASRPRSLFTALCDAGAIEFDFRDWCATRAACKDFISNCRAGDDSYAEADVRRHFFKLLREQISVMDERHSFEDCLDYIDYALSEELTTEMRRTRQYDEENGTQYRYAMPLIEERRKG